VLDIGATNVDFVRSIVAAWERSDYDSPGWAHHEIEFRFADGPDPSLWTGISGMSEGWRSFLKAWEGFRVVADEYRDIGGERVLVLYHFSGRGKTSGAEIGKLQTKNATVFHVNDGLVSRLVLYWDRDRALADLGLAD
jgi:hypothetical protein